MLLRKVFMRQLSQSNLAQAKSQITFLTTSCLMYCPLWTNSTYEAVKYKLFTTLCSTLDRLCSATEVLLRKWATRSLIHSHQSTADSHQTLCLEFCISWECCKPDDSIVIWCSRHSSCIKLLTIAPLSQKRVVLQRVARGRKRNWMQCWHENTQKQNQQGSMEQN